MMKTTKVNGLLRGLYMSKIYPIFLSGLILLLSMSDTKAFLLEELSFSIKQPSTSITVENNGKLSIPDDSERGFAISYSVENFPVIPDTKIEYTHIHITGSKVLTENLNLSDYTLEKGTKISTKVDGDNIKLTFYCQPLDKFNYDFINLEFGANFQFIDYKIKNKYRYNKDSWEDNIDISTLLPSIHFKVSLSPTYYFTIYTRGALPISDKRKDKEIEGGIKYYLNSQFSLFISYSYLLHKADEVNGYDFKTTSNTINIGASFLW